uniref:Uncharacterized protein n=1 Tax=Oryza brachyantha TaxID=4533 RepID=J3N8E7_ORYBR
CFSHPLCSSPLPPRVDNLPSSRGPDRPLPTHILFDRSLALATLTKSKVEYFNFGLAIKRWGCRYKITCHKLV